MRIFKFFARVFKNYSYGDKVISAFSIVLILGMILKLMLFPYGLFNFGAERIYTEGLVSKTGIQNLNPLFVEYNEADREVSQLIFSGLMKYDPETKGIVNDMADLEINEDQTQYTLKLKPGLQWHDGNVLTADDVYFTYHDLIMSAIFPNEILKANFAGVKIEQLDDLTVKFTLDSPNIFFSTNLTVGILPKHILGELSPADILQSEFNKMPVGSGPYMVTEPVASFADGRMQVTMQKNPYYYGEPNEIEFMRFIVYDSMDKLLDESTIVNGVVKISGDYILNFREDERFELIPYKLPQYTAVFMNLDSPILKDGRDVRLALQKAVDKEQLVAKFIDKEAVDTPLMQLNQDDWEYQPSLDQAQGALKESDYLYDEDDTEKTGFRYDEDGNVLALRFVARLYDEGTAQFEETRLVVTFLEEAWESVGFDIQIELLPLNEFKEAIASRDYDLLLVGQSLGYNLDTYSYWHSTQAIPGGQNLSNYKSFQVDSLIQDIRQTREPEKREEKLNNIAEALKEDIPAIFLYRPVYYYASDAKISGLNMDGVVFPSDRFSRLGEWAFLR